MWEGVLVTVRLVVRLKGDLKYAYYELTCGKLDLGFE